MESHVSATEAAKSFGRLLDRIRRRGEEFVVERGGEPVCRMTPAGPRRLVTLGDLARLLRETPKPDPDYAADVRRTIKRQRRA